MAQFDLQREVRTPHSESFFLVDESDRDVGRVEVHYPSGMVHATLMVQPDLTEADIRTIANRLIHEWGQTIGMDGAEVAIHVYQGEDRGVFTNDDSNSRRNGNGHSNN